MEELKTQFRCGGSGRYLELIESILKIRDDGKEITFNYDCRPEAIIERFDLRKPIYTQTARRGHFGFINDYPWEIF